MKIKNMFIIITILLLSSLTVACTDQEELEDIGIVIATGIDHEEEDILLTFEIIIPIDRATDSQTSHSKLIQSKGRSVMEAIRNMTLTFDSKLFFSHDAVIIFGEDFAKKGIGDYFDFFTKDNEPREKSYLLVAKGAKAYEVMGLNDGLSFTTGEYIEALVENTKYTLKSRSLDINEFIKYYYQRETPLLGVVKKKKEMNIEPGSGVSGSKDVLDVSGGAPFYKDKLIGYYSTDEMIGFNFIVDEVDEGIIVFEAPEELLEYSNVFSRAGKYITLEIVKSNTKNGIEIIDGNLSLDIYIDVKGTIAEDNMGLNTIALEVRDKIQEACEKQIKEYVTKAMDKGQEFKNDNFGINHLFHIAYTKEYKKVKDSWGYEFSKLDYSINVNVDLIRTGLTNTPSNIIKGEEF